MPVVDLQTAKCHLRVDGDHEDALILSYLDAATQNAADFLGRSIPWTDDDDKPVDVPAPVKSAILLILGDLYEHRTGQGPEQMHENRAVASLLWPYKLVHI